MGNDENKNPDVLNNPKNQVSDEAGQADMPVQPRQPGKIGDSEIISAPAQGLDDTPLAADVSAPEPIAPIEENNSENQISSAQQVSSVNNQEEIASTKYQVQETEQPLEQTISQSPFIETIPEQPHDLGQQFAPPPQPGEGQQFNQIPDNKQNISTSTPVPGIATSEETITTQAKPNDSRFKLFMIVGIILIVGVWGIVFYLYFKGRNENQPTPFPNITQDIQNPKLLTPVPTKAPTPKANEITIQNGNVVWISSEFGTKTLVSKENYPGTGITGFARVTTSPDGSFMCLESWPPSPEPALYMANIDATNVVKIGQARQSCLFTSDSKKILSVSMGAENQKTDIFSYEISTGLETNLSANYQSQGPYRFELVGLSSDGSTAICSFTKFDSSANGDCEINLATGEVNFIK